MDDRCTPVLECVGRIVGELPGEDPHDHRNVLQGLPGCAVVSTLSAMVHSFLCLSAGVLKMGKRKQDGPIKFGFHTSFPTWRRNLGSETHFS